MKQSFIIFIIASVFPIAGAQILGPILMSNAAASFPAISVGAECSGIGSTSTATCTMTPQAAGSTIYCWLKQPIGAYGSTSITDSVNTSAYQWADVLLRDSGHNFHLGTMYHENVAASSTVITLTYATSGASRLVCQEFKNVPTSYALDSSVLQSQALSGTNPANPNSLAPYANKSVVLSGVLVDSTTPTAGTNFTVIDGGALLFPEYWIQATATATTGPFVDAGSPGYAISMAALGQNHSGTCGITQVFPWIGGTIGNTPASADLLAGSYGTNAQPNADGITVRPGFNVGGTGVVYAGITAYQPLSTTRTCPFYSGSGTGTVGLKRPTSAGINQQVGWNFATTQTKVTGWTTQWTDTNTSTGGLTIDQASIVGSDNDGSISDYVLLQWNSSGHKWLLEAPGGNSASSTNSWTFSELYGFRLTYNYHSLHTIDIYDCGAVSAGAGCPSPTFLETLTASGSRATGGHADGFVPCGGSAMSYASGSNWFCGAAELDILYGATLTP